MKMLQRLVSLTLRSHVPDALAGLAVFVLILALTLSGTTVAAPTGPFNLDFSAPVWTPCGRQSAAVLLAGTVASLVTLNLAFFRHLLRAYASPRRAARRRRPETGIGRFSRQ